MKSALMSGFSTSPLSETLLDFCYPVGSIYTTSNSTFDPNESFGGTWTKIENAFLYGSGTKTVGQVGGSEEVTLTTAQIPIHNHTGTTNSVGTHTHTRGSMNITGKLGVSRTFSNLSYNLYETTSGAIYAEKVADNNMVGAEQGNRGLYRFSFDASRNWTGFTSSSGNHTHTITINNSGSGSAHSNMPPYRVVNIWERVS